MESKVTGMNTTALAYMGDAVYEVYVRKHVMGSGNPHVDSLHKNAVSYVRADAQAKVLKSMMNGFLSEEELALVKRARNHKIASKPQNASPMTYKLATAFEALIGCLYLSQDTERLEVVVAEALRIIGGKDHE